MSDLQSPLTGSWNAGVTCWMIQVVHVFVTWRMVATTSLSFSLQSSFWTQKSSCCSSCLSAGRRSEERNRGNNWHSLYLKDRWTGRQVCYMWCHTGKFDPALWTDLVELPDVGDGVVDQLQRRDQKVFVEVFPGENLSGHFTDIQEPQSVPIAPPLSQI